MQPVLEAAVRALGSNEEGRTRLTDREVFSSIPRAFWWGNLRVLDVERLRHGDAGVVHQFVEVVGLEGPLPEIGDDLLLANSRAEFLVRLGSPEPSVFDN